MGWFHTNWYGMNSNARCRNHGQKAKLSISQSLYQLWLATERIRLWIKETDMSFLYRVLGFRLRDKVRSLDIWMEVGVQLLLFQRRQLRRYGHLIKIPSGCFLLEVCCCGKGHWEYPASLLPPRSPRRMDGWMDGLTLKEKLRLLVTDHWNSLFYTGIMDALFNQTSLGVKTLLLMLQDSLTTLIRTGLKLFWLDSTSWLSISIVSRPQSVVLSCVCPSLPASVLVITFPPRSLNTSKWAKTPPGCP